jgi:hypothetical protein
MYVPTYMYLLLNSQPGAPSAVVLGYMYVHNSQQWRQMTHVLVYIHRTRTTLHVLHPLYANRQRNEHYIDCPGGVV